MSGAEFFDFLKQINQDLLQIGIPPKTLAELSQAVQALEKDTPADAAGFDKLPIQQQEILATRMAGIKQGLAVYADGSPNPKDIMAKQLASSRSVWILGFLAAGCTVALILAIVSLWSDATRPTTACNTGKSVSGKAGPSSSGQKPASSGSGSAGTPQASAAVAAASGAAGGNDATAKTTPKDDSGNPPEKAEKELEVTPNQTTLSTCESVALSVMGVQGAQVTWAQAPTGSLSNDGVYTAPSSIAGQQTISIGATVKDASGKSQTAKPASIVLLPPGGPDERHVLIMIVLMGALGGCLHWLSGFAFFVGNREFMRSWIAYYLLMPLEGASLAIIVYLLLRVGILAPTSVSGQATSNLNTVGLYAFSGLTGIYSKQALVSLGEVFNVIFAKVKAKDESKTESSNASPKDKTK